MGFAFKGRGRSYWRVRITDWDRPMAMYCTPQ
jgi:hypothetical protein